MGPCYAAQAGFRLHVCLCRLDSDYMYVCVPGATEVRGCAAFYYPLSSWRTLGPFHFLVILLPRPPRWLLILNVYKLSEEFCQCPDGEAEVNI